jgi:hypothetical protein
VISVCVPAFRTVPVAGEYTKVPGVFAEALSCSAESAVPYGMAVGAGHVIVGVAWPLAEPTEIRRLPDR